MCSAKSNIGFGPKADITLIIRVCGIASPSALAVLRDI
jgi:hypothetical protein